MRLQKHARRGDWQVQVAEAPITRIFTVDGQHWITEFSGANEAGQTVNYRLRMSRAEFERIRRVIDGQITTFRIGEADA